MPEPSPQARPNAPSQVHRSSAASTVAALASARARALRPGLRRWREHTGDWGLDAERGSLDLQAWLDGRLQRRRGDPHPVRPWRLARRRPVHATLCLLIDRSVSTGDAASDHRRKLDHAIEWASAVATAAVAEGIDLQLVAFSSHGRHQVQWLNLPVPGRVGPGCAQAGAAGRPGPSAAELLVRPAALRALTPQGSTRLGGVLRHAVWRLRRSPALRRAVWLLSDGQPHDIDSPDPRYLQADARAAWQGLRRAGIGLRCDDPGDVPAHAGTGMPGWRHWPLAPGRCHGNGAELPRPRP